MSKRSVIVILICLILCGALILGVTFLKNGQTQESVAAGSASEIQELNQLESKKNQINRKIKALKSSIEREKLGKGTASFVCVGAHKKVYNIVYPELQKKNYPGVLVLTEDLFVGGSDCITVEQLAELRNAGWEIAACFSAVEDDPIGSLKSLLEKMKGLGVDTVSTVYFDRNGYSASYDDALIGLGIRNAVFHGDGSGEQTSYLNPEHPSESSLWTVYSLSYATVGKETFLSTIEESGGSLAFEFTFDTSQISSYCTDYGVKNLLTVCNGRDSEKVDFLTLNGAREYVLSVYDGSDDVVPKLQRELRDLESDLADIEKQITSLRSSIE